jgi:hypothetical protein
MLKIIGNKIFQLMKIILKIKNLNIFIKILIMINKKLNTNQI